MIYIVGFTFQFNPQARPAASNMSVQEQILFSKRGGQKTSSSFDSRFVNGAKYRISLIHPVREGNETKHIIYGFENLSYPGSADIRIAMPSTSAGDEYIAAISGSVSQLAEVRKQIALSHEPDRV